jgi:hypothetical protein
MFQLENLILRLHKISVNLNFQNGVKRLKNHKTRFVTVLIRREHPLHQPIAKTRSFWRKTFSESIKVVLGHKCIL